MLIIINHLHFVNLEMGTEFAAIVVCRKPKEGCCRILILVNKLQHIESVTIKRACLVFLLALEH